MDVELIEKDGMYEVHVINVTGRCVNTYRYREYKRAKEVYDNTLLLIKAGN